MNAEPTAASTDPLTFRTTVSPDDRRVVRSLVESTGFFNPAEVDVAVELVEEHLAKGAAASGYWFVFAERGGRAIGYACYGPIAGTQASHDLFWIAVDRSCQAAGIGRLLLGEVERRIYEHGGRRVYIETSNRDQYVPTRTFYERCDYLREAILRDFYAPGDDKAIYVKVLEPKPAS
ncbi:MAG: GNAT family N-acetyltransferase [Pirellulales bacterium]|nr:GNAT family N-acetyltransferase [Pirellulales bacterium]